VAELVAHVQGAAGQYPGPTGHGVGQLAAAQRRHRELGDRHHRGAVQSTAECLGKFAVRHRVRGSCVDRSPDPVVVEGPEEEAHHVLEVNPRHVLLAARDRSADPELERQEKLSQQAAMLVQHQTGAEDHHPVEDSLGLPLRGLPVDRNLGREALTRLGFLVEDLRPAVTVVADRGLSDEDARLGRRRFDALEQVTGA
jgi:hypothetical protein